MIVCVIVSDFNINWKVRNLGVLTAEGYKCDSVYLSEDDKWDIKVRKEREGMLYLKAHSEHFIYDYIASDIKVRKERE